MKKKKNNVGGKVAVGASMAALAVAGYMLFGPDGKKNRKHLKGWAVKMKGEAIEKFEKMKDVTEPMFHKVVDELSAKYAKAKGVSKEEVSEVVSDLKKHWKIMSRGTKKVAKPAKKVARKAKK